MVEVGKIGGETLVLDGRYISIFRAGKLVWKRAYRGYILPDGNFYSYRRRVRITELSGKTLTDYQVKIEIGAGDPIFAHARSAGEDIRFCYYPEEEMLSYWIEKFDPVAEEAIIWVKVPSIPANSEIEIYMYYGNPTVASASDVIATFIRVIDGLVACWHLDEGSGTVAHDTSGNDNDGTIYGATWVDGKFGKALNFDGVDDYVEAPDSASLDIADSVTVETWLYIEKSEAEQKFIAKKYNYVLWIQANNEIRFADTLGNYVDTDPITEFNKFIHVIAVFKGKSGDAVTLDNAQIYINGVARGTHADGTWSAQTGQGYALRLGDWYGSDYLDGILDEVRIYNRALSEEEILDLYNNYGYTTTNYPGKVLVRKYTEPEPSVSVGAEE